VTMVAKLAPPPRIATGGRGVSNTPRLARRIRHTRRWQRRAAGYDATMRTSDHTAGEWTSLGIVFMVLGFALAISVSLIVGLAMLIPGILIILQIKSGIGPDPKPDKPARSD